MRTVGQVAKAIVNDTNCVLSVELQEKLIDIIDKENTALWAECNRACEQEMNKVLLRQMEKQSIF